MGKYGRGRAWDLASCEVYDRGSASQKKSCPKNAFLGLYGGKGKNAEYALAALKFLKANPNIELRERELWNIILRGEQKTYNDQMDVVISLYTEGYV